MCQKYALAGVPGYVLVPTKADLVISSMEFRAVFARGVTVLRTLVLRFLCSVRSGSLRSRLVRLST